MHHLAYLEMIIPRERERREKTEREETLAIRMWSGRNLFMGICLKSKESDI